MLMAQISQGGIPVSFKYNLKNDVDRIELQPQSIQNVLAEEAKYPKDGHIPHIGYSILTDISPENSGTWTQLPEGGRIWQLQIKSPSALALGIYYDHFHLPVGGKLFLYNEDKTQLIGAYTWTNNDESGFFANEMIYGDIVNIEYYEPGKVTSKLMLHINEVAYFYRGVENHKNTNWTEPSDVCEININCTPVGTNWQDEKKGVSRILVKEGTSYGYCTGSLINNTNQNCTPYYLTAYHCKGNATTADLNQWIFYFNYEAAGCTTPTTEPTSNTMTGATLKASANISGGSDFVLLQLNQTVPTSYNPYMNGWSRLNSVTGPGACIHHPAGSIKKISTFNSASTTTWSGGASQAHWSVTWVSNANGWGVTEGGSSGSPLFDANGRIVGTLTGGGSYCTAQSSPDAYGKLYYHWDLNAGGTTTQLKTWLDPTSSGVTTLDGKYCNGSSTPVAAFTGTPTTVAVGGAVTYTSQSTGTITSYSWSFPGGTPSTSTSAGPVTVTYNTAGVYNATLTVGTPTNTLTKTNYITVTNGTVPTCDTTNLMTSGLYWYSFANGNNSYGDKAKANYFAATVNGNTVQDIYLQFIYAKGSGNATINVWNNSGTGGAPGATALASKTVPISTIITDVNASQMTHVTLTSPLTLTGPCYVGVTLPTAAGDTVVLLADTSASAAYNVAWEKWNTNAWYAYNSPNSWGINAALGVWPVICSGTTGISESDQLPVSVFPNPANNLVYLVIPDSQGDVIELKVTDMYGKLCKIEKITSSLDGFARIELSGLSNGVYFIRGESAKGVFVKKISVIK